MRGVSNRVESARPATEADLGRVVELAELLAVELTPTRGGALWALREAPATPFADHYAGRLVDPDALVVVGLIDDQVIGFAVAVVEPLRDGSTLARIDDLFVERDARAVGVGECLGEAVVAWARGRGCRGIDACALPGNRAAKNFFETHGFVARAIVMHRPL